MNAKRGGKSQSTQTKSTQTESLRPHAGSISMTWMGQLLNESMVNDPTKVMSLVVASHSNTQNSVIMSCGEDLDFDVRLTPYEFTPRLHLLDFVYKRSDDRYREETGVKVYSIGVSGEDDACELPMLTRMVHTGMKDEIYSKQPKLGIQAMVLGSLGG